MIPTKNTLKEEIEYRISCIEDVMKSQDDRLLCALYANEHSMLREILHLIDVFGNRIGHDQFEATKHTPLFCAKTNEPLLIGDKVENNNGQCGTLHFDTYTKKYLIKSVGGGNIHTTYFAKIQNLYDYKVDSSRIECRSSDKYLKKRW